MSDFQQSENVAARVPILVFDLRRRVLNSPPGFIKNSIRNETKQHAHPETNSD